jgi:hypothetical protein
MVLKSSLDRGPTNTRVLTFAGTSTSEPVPEILETRRFSTPLKILLSLLCYLKNISVQIKLLLFDNTFYACYIVLKYN